MITEIRMIKPKLVASCSVKTVVCVKKPGPTAEVAIKNAAPKSAFEDFEADIEFQLGHRVSRRLKEEHRAYLFNLAVRFC